MYAAAKKAPSYFLSAASAALIAVYVSGKTVLVQAPAVVKFLLRLWELIEWLLNALLHVCILQQTFVSLRL